MKRDASDRVVFVDEPAYEQRIARDRLRELGSLLFSDFGALDDGVGLELGGQGGADRGNPAGESVRVAFDDVE